MSLERAKELTADFRRKWPNVTGIDDAHLAGWFHTAMQLGAEIIRADRKPRPMMCHRHHVIDCAECAARPAVPVQDALTTLRDEMAECQAKGKLEYWQLPRWIAKVEAALRREPPAVRSGLGGHLEACRWNDIQKRYECAEGCEIKRLNDLIVDAPPVVQLFPARLVELAKRGAAETHWDAIAEASISQPTTHKEPFHECPHGNCKLVREFPAVRTEKD